MICPNCGFSPIPETAGACPQCGQALPPSVPTTHITVDQDVGTVSGGTAIGAMIRKVVGNVIIHPPDPLAASEQRDKALLRQRVNSDWIEGVLLKVEAVHTRFSQGEALIQLYKETLPTAVAVQSEATGEVAFLETEEAAPASQRPIEAIFAEAGRSLLILGEPGSGKTITLLELARELLRRAEDDPNEPIPVVLNLASWATSRLKLDEWVVFELNTTRYGIPKEAGRRWLQKHDLLLLLDGLDEVSQPYREACVAAINQFVADFGLTGVVVCSRATEYRHLRTQLNLRQAILLQALTAEQINAYFDTAGPPLAGLRLVLQEDATLRALVDSPLMLHIMSATYRDVAAGEVAAGQEDTVAARRIRLFNDFVQRMFKRKVEDEKPYSDAQTTTWLSWLARRMEQHNQTTFLIEELQPSWLPAGGWQWAYMLTSRFIVSLLGGWLGGSIIGLGLVSSESTSLALALQRGLVEGVIGGLITGAVVGLVDIAWIARLNQRPLIKTMSPVRQSLLKILLVTLIVTIMVALLFTLTFGAIQWLGGDRTDWLFEGMSVGLVFGLSAALVFAFGPKGIRDSLANDIHTVERLSWSLTGAMPGGLIGVAIGALTGAIAGVVAQDTPTVKPLVDRGLPTATIAVTMMLIGAVIVGLIGFIFGGLTGTFLKIEKVTPNQGLRLSLVNSLMTGSLIGLLFAGLGLLLGEIVGSAADALTYGIYGLFIGFLASLWYGGFFLLQHSGLRLMLWARGDTPPPGQLADFLDYAAQRIFLRKIGGGYIFLHRYLLEHFAGLSGP